MPISFTQPIFHGGDCLYLEALPMRSHIPLPQGLSIRTYNIRDSRGFGLAQAIRAVQIGIFDLTVLTKTKFTD